MNEANDGAVRRLRRMILIRKFEDRTYREYATSASPIGGFLHLCNGQEAVAVGAAESFRPEVDAYVGTFRSHGWALALGTPARVAMAGPFKSLTRDNCRRSPTAR